MNITDILQQYAVRPTDTQTDFDEVSRQVPADVLGGGIAQAFRSEQTPDFGNMIGSLFGGSNSQQRAGLLGQLIRSVAPAVLSGLAGGTLGRLVQGMKGGGAAPEVTPAQIEHITPEQVQEVATAAEQNDPSVLDRVGAFYAEHPEVVKVLGGAALAIALGQMAQRMKR
ncbi:MAG: hypothetical protein ABI699_16700 [Caldimonas sp.]